MLRNLIVVLGDQLNADSSAFDGFDAATDMVWMAEVRDECTYAWSHKVRIVMFLSAMRHFAEDLRRRGIRVEYHEMAEGSLVEKARASIRQHRPKRTILTEPGEWRLKDAFAFAEIRPDRHFLCSGEEFREWTADKKQLRMEFFYRKMRARHGYLMERGEPVGGKWNFDTENRKGFPKAGPPAMFRRKEFPPDAITREVMEMVEREFPDHPGKLANFDFPVTPEQAAHALEEFVQYALPHFGSFQDAMWTGEPVLFHSRISAAMNLKMLDPRAAIGATAQAYHDGAAPLAAAEGFIRQILGWREYVRGVYWLYMPEYLERNYLNAHEPLPAFYWTGETDMACLHEAIGQTLDYGYAHHIQRLMVTGLYALLLGVEPKQVHEWYLAVYVDAVEWVELPNTLGMSQYGDGGVMGSKPYIASGKYIQRMSNYCGKCRYDPALASGENACPFTKMYWEFLDKHDKLLSKNPRMTMQLNNARRRRAGA